MGIVLHSQNLPDILIPSMKGESRVKLMLMNWMARNANLKRQWENYSESSMGDRVSYRVWSRHGAYLEMLRTSRNYD